jgi:hypothetical protein
VHAIGPQPNAMKLAQAASVGADSTLEIHHDGIRLERDLPAHPVLARDSLTKECIELVPGSGAPESRVVGGEVGSKWLSMPRFSGRFC